MIDSSPPHCIYVVTNVDVHGPYVHEEHGDLRDAEYRKGFLETRYPGARVTISRLSGKDRRVLP